eukprot:scaffold66792_cov57-Phaeocystis_antarctica.AAC.4
MEATLAAQASRATADVRLQCMSGAGVGRSRRASSSASTRLSGNTAARSVGCLQKKRRLVQMALSTFATKLHGR